MTATSQDMASKQVTERIAEKDLREDGALAGEIVRYAWLNDELGTLDHLES